MKELAEQTLIRLLAVDLDLTVFGADLVVAATVREAIGRAQHSGVAVTIATGREASLASRFARELGIAAPIICAQGSCIYDHVRKQILHDVRMERHLLPRILDAARHYRWNIHFDVHDELYFPQESSHPPVVFELMRYSNWVRVGNLLTDMPEPPSKLIVSLNQLEDLERILGEMRDALGNDLTVVHTHPHLVEALPKGIDKKHGLEWLARHLGVAQSEVMAIGDSEADVTMIRWAGVGVAMGNGSAAVKEAADWVAPSLEEHGVAAAIAKFILK